MVLLRHCCGINLRTSSLSICYVYLIQQIVFLGLTISASDNQRTRSTIFVRNVSDSVRYFQIFTTVFNIFVIGTALLGLHKRKPPLIIPYLAYRTVNIIFSTLALFDARAIADNVNELMENSLNNERDQTFDSLPLLVCIMIVCIGLDVYLLFVVLSYYQSLMINLVTVAVTVPVVAYTTAPSSGHDNLESMYSQPATNPYLISDGKVPSPPPYDPYVPTYGYPYYGPPYGGRSSMVNLPPPYRP